VLYGDGQRRVMIRRSLVGDIVWTPVVSVVPIVTGPRFESCCGTHWRGRGSFRGTIAIISIASPKS
jgi:hypothetical protein